MNSKTDLYASRYERPGYGIQMKTSFASQVDRKSPKLTKAFEKTQIQVKNQILDDLLQVYGWRSKAELPIAKVMFYKVLERNPNQPTTTIEVSYESFPVTLSDLSQISVANLVYLLKEAIVGFEKLFSVFGSFLISNKMIGINKNNRCKVWINQNFAINEPIDVEMFKNLSQKQFLAQINVLFKKKAEKNKKNQTLFNDLNQCQKFQEYIKSIDTYCKNNKIEMGNCYRPDLNEERKNNVSKSPLRNPNQLTNNSFIGQKTKQVPKFLNKSNINDQTKSIIGNSQINQRLDKSRSITKSGIRNRTPLNHNRSQLNLHSPYRPDAKSPIKVHKKQGQSDKKMDYSFEKKNKSSSPLQQKKPKPMIESTNSLNNQDIQGLSQGKSFLNYQKKDFSLNQVLKSDLNTNHTNSSGITTVSPRRLLQKKNSLFDAQMNMLESIVIGNEHDRPKNTLFSTADLQHLGKLGKTVIQSCMPEDFDN